MERKNVELIEAKAEGQGIVRALASVFGNVDRVGDKMLPGSFSKTLATWRRSGRSIPVIFSHGSDNPMNFVGTADPHRVIETADGLEVEAELDVDENPVAKQVYNLLRKGSLPGWSFGFVVPPGGKKRRDGYTEISEVELFEVGPTLVGANPEARTLAVKALETLDPAEPLAKATAGLTESERETYERLREEHRAEQQAKAEAEQEKETPSMSRNWVPAREPDPDKVISVLGTRVRVSDIRVNGR